MIRCLSCGAETSNGLALCQKCQQTLRVALTNAAAFYADVERIRPGQRVKVRSAYQSTPPPETEDGYDSISAVLDETDNAASTWSRSLVEDRPTIRKPPSDTGATLGWLESYTETIATLEWGGEIIREMRRIERRLQRVLDKADTGWYAGKCGAGLEPERMHDGTMCACSCHLGTACDVPGGCGEPGIIAAVVCERGLYGTVGVNWIRCPECGSTFDVSQRREVLMREARNEVAPVSVVARAVVGLLDDEASVHRLANRIDKWVQRGKLRDLGVRVLADGKPHRVYRIGDVFDLLGQVPPVSDEAC